MIYRRGRCGALLCIRTFALGQWGELMLEVVQQEGEGASPFRDMYAPGEEGIHHVACFVDSIDQAVSDYEQKGFPLAARAKAQVGTEFVFIDARSQLGHMLEIYVADEALSGFYQMVREASVGWDAKDVFASFPVT